MSPRKCGDWRGAADWFGPSDWATYSYVVPNPLVYAAGANTDAKTVPNSAPSIRLSHVHGSVRGWEPTVLEQLAE